MNLEQSIRKELQLNLPGKKLHRQLMATHYPPFKTQRTKTILAAVALVIYSPQKFSYATVLIRRTKDKSYHSGQISFPGGKADQKDSSLLYTAIRETREEIGIELREQECLGTLTPIDIRVSGFKVTPFLFFYNEPIDTKVNKEEVDYLIHCDLSSLLVENNIKTTRFMLRNHLIHTPYIDVEGEMVWGATLMILEEFVEILKRIEIKNPDLIRTGISKKQI
jgi:8-oxo-dGTP pyrophosphatase MutT (NUDIX family)